MRVIEEALDIGADRMSWIQTSYLIAEIITIPLTGLLMRVLVDAHAGDRGDDAVHGRLHRLRA